MGADWPNLDTMTSDSVTNECGLTGQSPINLSTDATWDESS